MEKSVIIIGAGISGLVAARELARQHWEVTVLEARERVGGRIHTVMGPGNRPVELGAEFVHGQDNITWEHIRQDHLRTVEVPDLHWQLHNGSLTANHHFWEQLGEASKRINTLTPDQDFQSFLDQAWSLSPNAKWLAKEYVEGFHAADADRISIHALAKAEAAAERQQGTHQYRIADGYMTLFHSIREELKQKDVRIELSTVAKTLKWEPGQIEISAETEAGLREFHAECAIVTLPLSVMQNPSGRGYLRMDPDTGKDAAVQQLAMGSVSKVTLLFSVRFWPVEDFGFIHARDRAFPTWWSNQVPTMITGWSGGPRARRLNRCPVEEIFSEALRALSEIFKVEESRIREALVGRYTHNWDADPFALGAYSYTPARAGTLPGVLAAPVGRTIFFAGEATDMGGDSGTVHGAINSGTRAAREVLEASQQRNARPSRVHAHA